MPSRPAQEGLSPFKLPPGRRSRKGSLSSMSSRPNLDKETLAQALDQIHSSASRSDGLTTFDEFAPPAGSSLGADGRGLAGDIMQAGQAGLSGLYNRLRASVGAGRETGIGSSTKAGNESPDTMSVSGQKPRAVSKPVKSSPSTAISSPVVVSTSSSRLQSPSAATFQESYSSLPYAPTIPSIASVSKLSASDPNAPPAPPPRTKSVTEPTASKAARTDDSYTPRTSSPATRSQFAEGTSQSPADFPLVADVLQRFPAEGLAQATLSQQGLDAAVLSDIVASASAREDTFALGSRGAEAQIKPKNNSMGNIELVSTDDTRIVPMDSLQAAANPGDLSGTQYDENVSQKISDSGLDAAPRTVERHSRLQNSLFQPGSNRSYSPSSDGLSSVTLVTAARQPSVSTVAEHPRPGPGSRAIDNVPDRAFSQMRNRILGKEFWMKDENAKDCFYCGEAFSTFRRKHHCRLCGQIFDGKCTSVVSGRLFSMPGHVRVCKPCEAIIHGNDDDSSFYSDDGDVDSLHGMSGPANDTEVGRHGSALKPKSLQAHLDTPAFGTPTMGIPVSRKPGENKRRSAIIEFEDQPILARPSSSRSLRSLAGRPRSSSHKRHHSRHQHMRSMKSSREDLAPFHQQETIDSTKRSGLPAFHHDSIIDPDLAPFMSDEGSSEDEQASIFTTMNSDRPASLPTGHERSSLGGLLAALRKGKSRAGDSKALGGSMAPSRDADNVSLASRHQPRRSRNHNLSISNNAIVKPSPRRSKSNSLLRTIGAGFGNMSGSPPVAEQPLDFLNSGGSHMIRSASMRGAGAPAIELNRASLEHARKLLRQMLQDYKMPGTSSWEKALIPILLQCTDDVNPDIQRHDDIDIRNYIKLKKIPGGKPGDTAYVSGVVFTKNVALKTMPRSIKHPRIVIVTFAIEYARHHQHFMSLEPVIAQEREYLENLVGRIAALKPHVLLVQRNVSGLALQLLDKAGIAVAYNVKLSVLNAVSRCTQARMISSIDKLVGDPSYIGTCSSFDVKTYVYDNRKKTYIYLSGCRPELGCTVVLRGASLDCLRRLKRITDFLCYVVYNLKLETSLLRDEFVLIPASTDTGTISSGIKLAKEAITNAHAQPDTSAAGEARAPQDAQEQVVHATADKSSFTEAPNNDNTNAPLNSHQSTAEVTTGSEVKQDEPPVPEDVPMPSFYGDMVEKHKTRILSSSPFVKYMQPYLLMKAREQERRLAWLKRLRDEYTDKEQTSEGGEATAEFELVQPDMVHNVPQKASKQVREFLHAVHAAEYDKAMHNYLTQKRQWEAYISGNIDLFDPFAHQKIAVLYSLVNTTTSTPCFGPEIISFDFYNERKPDLEADCTLGQYVEDLCQGAYDKCTSNVCDKRMLDHHRQYVHGDGQMSVIVEKYPSKLPGLAHTILMWSVCRICGQETSVMPMSDNTWKYSFGKYLELTFWSSQLHPRARVCPHDIHKDHVRYIGFKDIALRIQHDPIHLYEIIVPRSIVAWKVDNDLRLKNEQFTKIEARLGRFMNSVKARLKSIHAESVVPEKVEACKVELERLNKKANDEHDALKRKLQEKYMNSRYYEIVPLNRAVRYIQEKAIAWDEVFAEFERQFFPSEKDIRRLAALQLRKIFLDRDESVTSINSIEEEPDETATENTGTNTPSRSGSVTVAPRPSHMSPEEAHDVLDSVVKEDRSASVEESSGEDPKKNEDVNGSTVVPAAEKSPLHLPIETPLQSLDREDVRHLDLAVSSNFPDIPPVAEQLDTARLPSEDISATLSHASTDPPTVPVPLDRSMSEIVEPTHSMTGPQALEGASELSSESRIPRLVEAIRREGASRLPLSRAQTQPTTSNRQEATSLDTTSPTTPATPGITSNSDPPRPTLAEAAKALEKRMVERLGIHAHRIGKPSTGSMIPRSVPNKRGDSKVSALAKHFDQLSREFEKERLRERRQRAARSRQARAYPLASSRPIVEVYRDAHEAVHGRRTPEEDLPSSPPTRPSTETSTSLEDSAMTENTAPTTGDESPIEERPTDDGPSKPSEGEDRPASPSGHVSDAENDASDNEHTVLDDFYMPEGIIDEGQILSPSESQLDLSLDLPKHEKTSLMKMLTSFWSERSASGWAPLDYPFAPIEHVWEDSDIIVREDEPSSIIALALSSPDYLSKLQAFRAQASAEEVGIDVPLQDPDEASIERNLLHQANTNIRYAFQNRGVRAQCKIFYAQSFDALRRKCGVADRFVESLSRCLKWDSKGGKTKSLFLKTLDDRFVLKSLSPVEVNAFFKFAPNYFSFVHQNLFKGLPSLIAKMFGLFQVVIKNPATGRDFDWFMLVMENLFYDRVPNRRFDLKGSMRNRKIQSTGERDEVLLDENLVDIIFEQPIFVREHTKKLLSTGVWNDTLFLSLRNVMDYSLMAGFDDERKEIIVGIIDCIRTYTWDKKLESWIKDRGKNKPTITSPKEYRKRFREAMSAYILQAPNCWHGYQQQIQKATLKMEPKREGREANEGEEEAQAQVIV
ncbi:Mitochondrial distribution and morphology protein 12 [Coniosporium apollinis]|uniref:1-phosphatidylinositol-3-phosphate 5-kinase n=1 Tax=Coniosporium apollinis TaxID=61459 RepID=A0ABQ9NRI6_9PEZI|nr:Mitochondrial distribution and morphology protein 12 [Coniosporium apollinis]